MKQCALCNTYKPLSYYYKGNGNDGFHYWCIQCLKERNAKNYKNNKEKVLARGALRRIQKSNEINAYMKKYRENNKDKRNAGYAKRRATKMNASVCWGNKFYINEAYHLAMIRTELTGIEWHVDHVIPLIHDKVCGLHCEDNLQVIPALQNLSKGNRHEI